MGCGESKIKRINLPPPASFDSGDVKVKIDTVDSCDESSGHLQQLHPSRLLSAIPVSDLGDSLDSRHLNESINLSQSLGIVMPCGHNITQTFRILHMIGKFYLGGGSKP